MAYIKRCACGNPFVVPEYPSEECVDKAIAEGVFTKCDDCLTTEEMEQNSVIMKKVIDEYDFESDPSKLFSDGAQCWALQENIDEGVIA
jgi:hypothetical protein